MNIIKAVVRQAARQFFAFYNSKQGASVFSQICKQLYFLNSVLRIVFK